MHVNRSMHARTPIDSACTCIVRATLWLRARAASLSGTHQPSPDTTVVRTDPLACPGALYVAPAGERGPSGRPLQALTNLYLLPNIPQGLGTEKVNSAPDKSSRSGPQTRKGGRAGVAHTCMRGGVRHGSATGGSAAHGASTWTQKRVAASAVAVRCICPKNYNQGARQSFDACTHAD